MSQRATFLAGLAVVLVLALFALRETVSAPDGQDPIPGVDVVQLREDCQAAGGRFESSRDANGTYAGCDYSKAGGGHG